MNIISLTLGLLCVLALIAAAITGRDWAASTDDEIKRFAPMLCAGYSALCVVLGLLALAATD